MDTNQPAVAGTWVTPQLQRSGDAGGARYYVESSSSVLNGLS